MSGESGCNGLSFRRADGLHFGEVLGSDDMHYQVRDLVAAELVPAKHLPGFTGEKEYFRLSSTQLVDKFDIERMLKVADMREFRPGRGGNILVRQSYDPDLQSFTPAEPDFKCTCGKVLNPDENYSICLECPAGFHTECVSAACPNCSHRLKVRKDDVLVIDCQQPVHPSLPSIPTPLPTSLQAMRSAVVSRLCTALFEPINTCSDLLQSLPESIESALYEASGRLDNSALYTRQARALRFNLKDNAELREAVRLGLIAPDKLVLMTSQEMANQEIRKLRQKREEFTMKKRRKFGENEREDQEEDPFDPNNH